MKISLRQIETGFAGERCYVHARGAVAPDGFGMVTTQPLRLSGSDIFYGLCMMSTPDGGVSWTPIAACPELARRPWGDGNEIVMADATPGWHAASGKFLLTGQGTIYRDDEPLPAPSPSYVMYGVYDREAGKWGEPEILALPEAFFACGAGCTQRFDLPNGEILLPVYGMDYAGAANPWENSYSAHVLRLGFDGNRLELREIGPALTWPEPRGFCEPSLISVGGEYFLTLRNDLAGYVARSSDGLCFDRPEEWRFDDGTPLGNYNTQQHWIELAGELYLVYTRRGADNDHIFRHRAPLFIARVDRETLRVIRESETVAVPERGARLGNFGCARIDAGRAWIVAAEWMQTVEPDPCDWRRCMEYGSDNSIFIAEVCTNS